ncbi:MAG: DoxX family protein [Planctomycetota bacterium]|nr:DoxX family protein [Planctomycetota bacterium]
MAADKNAEKTSGKAPGKSASKGASGASPSFGLVLVRVATGAILLYAGAQKLEAGVGEDLVARTASGWAESPELVRAWGENVVLRHPWFFANLVAWGEVVLGACLFLGLLTRPAGILAAFLFANAVFAVDGSHKSLALLLGICCAACALSRAGRSAGADVFLDGKLPGWLTWTRA